MNFRHVFLSLLSVIVLFVCACKCVQSLAENAAFAVTQHYLGPAAGDPPAPVDCSDVTGPLTSGPLNMASALVSPSGACITSYQGNGDCAACISGECCAQAVACFANTNTCTCPLGQRTPGVDWPEDAPCGEADENYAPMIACLTAHCSAECPLKAAP